MNEYDEIGKYIVRAVPDIARKIGCTNDKVWEEMYLLSDYKIKQHG